MIETSRLRIVPFGEEHLTARYVGWLADPEVVRFSEQRYRTHTLESCREYWRSFEGSPNLFLALVAKDPALGHVGNMNVYFEPRHGVADIGILLGERSVWGRGFGTEAWAAVMEHVFDATSTRKITGGCVAANTAMVRIMRRCGMVDDGRRVRHYVYDGVEVDLYYAAAFRGQWSAASVRREAS